MTSPIKIVRYATLLFLFLLLFPTPLHATPFPRVGPGYSSLFPPFLNQLGRLTSDNMIFPIGPANPGEWQNRFCHSNYLAERAKNDYILQEDMQSTSVSHQQHQSEVMMTPAVTTLLLLTTITSLASYSPPVKLLPGDNSLTQTGGRIET